MSQKIFADGIMFKRPREGAPDFVRGGLSIKVDDFAKFLNAHKGETGWVNLDLKESKGGKLYLELNTFVKKSEQPEESVASTAAAFESTLTEEEKAQIRKLREQNSKRAADISPEDIPFP